MTRTQRGSVASGSPPVSEVRRAAARLALAAGKAAGRPHDPHMQAIIDGREDVGSSVSATTPPSPVSEVRRAAARLALAAGKAAGRPHDPHMQAIVDGRED
ncbi:hypothetical protein Gbro_1031 [Gordonia bronchialis DSM 43247]|uniref:Uncharacterized protein n=1 Tax=Gordonia bronchialis (strain ATCC 25592 / DSM 43247 / BCRC 13721 / JCM 3198 / KCTC 3076 / NBRC 16047 / NCTC 10667) TaxID=526226 RepID=D0L4B7_GORB4|nr:hypothetical protein [Gordonia bronchialis]ACY20341.1 hypothetical protein Gbro_1031 [Gordonia bronchialis DSM 43247]MCC3323117.1 hypothetical protein [Gordonia bronchialis]QGS25850.1 hypothetical protein FOB84_18695 [Gordonia bronchialis]STQ63145.1 Uncharacterised protein [Gordonia bronchialis]